MAADPREAPRWPRGPGGRSRRATTRPASARTPPTPHNRPIRPRPSWPCSCRLGSASSPPERRWMDRVRGVGREQVSRTSSIPQAGGGEGGGLGRSARTSARSSLGAAKAGRSCPSKAIAVSTKASDARWGSAPSARSGVPAAKAAASGQRGAEPGAAGLGDRPRRAPMPPRGPSVSTMPLGRPKGAASSWAAPAEPAAAGVGVEPTAQRGVRRRDGTPSMMDERRGVRCGGGGGPKRGGEGGPAARRLHAAVLVKEARVAAGDPAPPEDDSDVRGACIGEHHGDPAWARRIRRRPA